MLRLIRAGLLGVTLGVLGVFVVWYIYMPNTNRQAEQYEKLLQLEERLHQEHLESILAARKKQTLASDQQTPPEPVEATHGELVFTEDTLIYQPELFTDEYERHLVATDHNSNALWLSHKDDSFSKLQWWHPANGKLRTFQLPEKSMLYLEPPLTLANSTGLLVIGGEFTPHKRGVYDTTRLVFVDPEGYFITSSLQVIRENQSLIALNDGSILVFGGFNIDILPDRRRKNYLKAVRTGSSMAVERIRYIDRQLQIDRLTDVPGEARRGMQMVELDNGQVMIVGGSSSQYLGNRPMTAETHILDVNANSWRTGPLMTTPRTNPALQRLPDGDVLVTGGWTPEFDWQDGPSTSTELWEADNNRFVAASSLPLPLALHQALWAPGQQGRQLLLLGGMSGSNDGNDQVLALDLAKKTWRNVAQNCQDYRGKNVRVKVASHLHDNIPYLICYQTDTPIESAWTDNVLRLPGMAADNQLALDDTNQGINLKRIGMAFLPPEENQPGLAAGGYTNGAQSAAADALLPDGRVISLAPMNHRRAGAQAFRLGTDAWLVTGGTQGDPTRRTQKTPPAELLVFSDSLEQANWQEIDIGLQNGALLAQRQDSSLVSINPDGSVEQLRLEMDSQNNWHVASRSTLPSLNRARNEDFSRMTTRALDDDRLIVAGGSVQQYRVALLDEATINGTEPDRYQSFGYFEPARHYDIYNPETHRWEMSAALAHETHRFAILSDGRVVTWGTRELIDKSNTSEGNTDETQAVLQISSSDGKQWHPLSSSSPNIDFGHPTNNDTLYVISDELFIAGTMPKSSSRHRLDAVEWFNPQNKNWQKLWQAEERNSLLDHHGHIIQRKLANGKQVTLPVKAP